MRYMAQNYPQNIKFALFNMFFHLPGGVASYVPWLEWLPLPRTITSYIGEKLTEYGHSEAELRAWKRHEDIAANGVGYSAIQRSRVRLSLDIFALAFTKRYITNFQPATIGYAIGASPLSLLAYVGEKMLAWSDPKHVDLNDILATVAIYYLTESFHTSVMIYQQSKPKTEEIGSYRTIGRIKTTKIGYSLFVRTPSSNRFEDILT